MIGWLNPVAAATMRTVAALFLYMKRCARTIAVRNRSATLWWWVSQGRLTTYVP